MGYGKKGKKSKQALLKEYENLRTQRMLNIIVAVVGVLIVVVSLVLQALAQGLIASLDEGMVAGLSTGSFVGIGLGAIVAAVGMIKFVAVNADYKVAAEKIK